MSEENKIKIQVVYTTSLSTFVQRDIDLLSKNYTVTSLLSNDSRSFIAALRGVRKNDVSFLWFATMTSAAVILASKLFRKPSILILGGADVASVPEHNYGLLARPFYRIFPILAIKHATSVLAVDEGLVQDVKKNTRIKREDIEVLPTGYDSEKYKPAGEKKRMALTVCSGSTWDRLKIKGIDTFIEVSNKMPDIPFVIIGLHGTIVDEVMQKSTGNLKVIGPLPENEVIQYYQMAKVYCQFSIREGLPNALCEAMLCECVPVGTDVQGVRTAIGDAGFLVSPLNLDCVTEKTYLALASDSGGKCRLRIKRKFSPELREKEIVELLNAHIHEK